MKIKHNSTHLARFFEAFTKIVLIILLTASFYSVQPAGVAHAATLFVSTTGSNSPNDCLSYGSPCETITYAMTQASDGDTINVAAGTYTENHIVVVLDLTITGAGPALTIVQAATTQSSATTDVFFVHTSATAVIEKMTIRHGNSQYFGGGIATGGVLTLNEVVVTRNNVTDSSSGRGGGIYTDGFNGPGMLTLNNSTVSNNDSEKDGGGIYNDQGSVIVNNSTISDNTANNWGGGIYCAEITCTVVLNRSTISGNAAAVYGGGILNYDGTVTLNNSTVSGNTANDWGGGIFNYNTSAQLRLNSSTVTTNTADLDNDDVGNGGGIGNMSSATTVMTGSIVAGNNDKSTPAADDCGNWNGSITSQGYNLINSATGCPNNTGTDQTPASPLSNDLDPNLADNGGPTLTHALPYSSSRAIDMVSCTVVPDNGRDQRGAGRDFDGDGSASSFECDAGAYEFRDPEQECSVTDDNTYTFGSVEIEIPSGGGGNIDCLTVEEMGADHLRAPGSASDTNWWHIFAEDSIGDPASVYTVHLTLPHSSFSDPMICKYPGTQGGYGWDCFDPHSPGATSSTLNNVTSLSDWAVGDDVGPTAVMLQSLHAQSGVGVSNQRVLQAVLLVLTAGAAALVWRGRSSKGQFYN